MSIRMFKALLSSSIFTLSFLLASCGEGERKLVTVEAEPEEEPGVPLVVHAGGVKGPLVNAKVSLYKVDFEAPDYRRYVSAVQGFYRLLDEHGITLVDGEVPPTAPAQALESIKNYIAQSGYVSELPVLKHKLLPDGRDDAEALERTPANATAMLDEYLVDETNALLADAVRAVRSRHASVKDLYNKIDVIPTLLSEAKEAKSLSEVSGLISKYRARETDADKLAGFDRLRQQVSQLSATTLSGLLSQLRDIQSAPEQWRSGAEDAACEDYSTGSRHTSEDGVVAVNQLSELIKKIEKSDDIEEAETILQEGWRKEGNNILKGCLGSTLSSLINLNDAIELIASDEALYLLRHDLGEAAIANASSLNELVATVQTALGERARPAIESALKSRFDKDVTDTTAVLPSPNVTNRPANFIKEGMTGQQARYSADLGDYRGFVYMVVESEDGATDLNNGQVSSFPVLETIFNTDDIQGYGDNSKEDLTRYFLQDGQKVRDQDGNLIVDREKLPTGIDALETFPARYATPLTSMSLALFKEAVSDPKFIYGNYRFAEVYSGTGLPDFAWNQLFFNDMPDNLSGNVWQSFGSGALDALLFNSTPVFTREMEWDRSSQISTARYRTYSESFAALVKQVADDLGVPVPEILSALARDLVDGEIDGKQYDTIIPVTANYAPLHVLAKRHPDVVPILGTLFNVDDSLQLMKSQLSRLEPEATPGKFDLRASDLALSAPVAGIDSDGDEVLDNSDDFPSDPDQQVDLAQDYAGLWSVSYDVSRPFVMPFDGRESIMFSRQQAYGRCTTPPCFSVGNSSVPVTAVWSIVAKPQNSDMEVMARIDEGNVGASVSVTTPGSYLLKGEFTSAAPERTQAVLVPITVIDPRSIALRFTPERPDVGEPVLIEFKVTDDLCRLVDCTSLNRTDATDDYLPIESLGQNFSVIWEVDPADAGAQGFRQVHSRVDGSTVVNDLNTRYGDHVRARVMFHSTSGGALPVHFQLGSADVAVGTPLDYDNDGVANELDAYPDDSACWRKDAGTSIEDEAAPGGMRLVCNDSLMADADSERSFDIRFGNEGNYYVDEEWYYHPAWGQFLRKDITPDPDLYRSPILFSSLKNNPNSENANQPVPSQSDEARVLGGNGVTISQGNKRVYFVLDDNELVYFDVVKGELYKFWKPENAAIRITDLHIVKRFVVATLEQDGNQSFVLLTESGKRPDVRAQTFYPEPGHELSVQVDARPMSVLADTFDFSWQIERSANDGSVENIPAAVSDDGLRLLAGQTRYGDRVTLTLLANIEDDQQAVLTQPFYVLGGDGFKFKDKFNDLKTQGSSISVEMDGADLKDKPVNAGVLSVNWYKNGKTEENYDRLMFTDFMFPFQITPERNINGQPVNPEYGDIITADVRLKLGSEFILLKRLVTVVMPNPKEFFKVSAAETDVVANGRQLRIVVDSGIEENDEFYRRFFAPYARWSIENVLVPVDEVQGFPVFETTRVKYGQTITLFFQYKVGEESGETGTAFSYVLMFNPETAEFDINPKVPQEGEPLSFDFSAYTQASVVGGYRPRWVINGVIDQLELGWTYPANKLQYGDKVELYLDPLSNSSEGGAAFRHKATVYIGINSGDARDDRDADLDSDGDGVPNQSDYFRNDPACSAIEEGLPDDRDGDGVSDLVEIKNGSNPNDADTDDDELNDGQERVMSSNPNATDSDLDGYSDYAEYLAGTNPNSNLSPGGSIIDLDKDGLSNERELQLGLFVNRKDSDGDGLWDGFEIMDPDGDGIANWSDADNDGVPDILEDISLASLLDTDGDGSVDALDADSDNDGLSDGAEVYITKTNRLVINSDADDLEDGVEVVLVGSNPTVSDTDNNGISDDREEYAQGVGELPDGLLRGIGDLDDYEYGKTKPSVPPGTCYASWLDRQSAYSMVESEHDQVNASSQQRLLFSHYGWNEVLLFDANQNQFAGAIFEPGVTQNVTAMAFDAENLNRIYLGYADGTVKRLDRGVPSERNQDRPVFSVGARQEILSIKSKADILLVETADPNNPDGYRHYIFDATDLSLSPDGIDPIDDLPSTASYRSAIWRNATARDSLLLVNSATGDVFEETIPDDVSNSNAFDQELLTTAPTTHLPESFYLDAITGVPLLRFADGWQYRLLPPADPLIPRWSDGDVFGRGLNHQNHRIETSYDNAQITLIDSLGSSGWSQVTQPEKDAVISMVPVGSDVLIISRDSSGPATAFGFSVMAVGDSDVDGLPGWWEAAMGTSDDHGIAHDDLPVPGDQFGRTYQMLFDRDYSYPDLGMDSDGDRLSDARERTLGTNLYSEDTDGDGLTDFEEVETWRTSPLKKDTDDDSLDDKTELFETFTNVLNADSDNDGLMDGYEHLVLHTRPLLLDSDADGTSDGDEDQDGDGLANRHELSLTMTNPTVRDSDRNGISDGDEDFDRDELTNIEEITGAEFTPPVPTSPNNRDSDGDGLLDGWEADITQTNPQRIDSDIDGIADGMEDSDGDSLSDLVELTQTFTSVDQIDSDSDQTPDNLEDYDGDGWTNERELFMGFRPDRFDTDGDGISDAQEDRDNDGLSDWVEIFSTFTSHLLADTDGNDVLDGDEDLDGDGWINLQEVQFGTCPVVNAYINKHIAEVLGACADPTDTDQDGLSDYDEAITHGTNPLSVDTDADGLTDVIEITPFSVNTEDDEGNPSVIQVTSDPTSADGDGDELRDYIERLGSQIYPEWRTNPMKADTDGDGLSDSFEFGYSFAGRVILPRVGISVNTKLNPNRRDTDGDDGDVRNRLMDYDEVRTYGTNPAEPDTDFDGINDYDEIFGSVNTDSKNYDSDGDGIHDGDEALIGTRPTMEDSDNDGTPDGNEDFDGDGLTDAQELYRTLTRFGDDDSDDNGTPDAAEDADRDRLTALQEMIHGTDPHKADTDGDNVYVAGNGRLESDKPDLSDGGEVLDHFTNPLIVDTDNDGKHDNEELWPSVNGNRSSISVSDPRIKDTDSDHWEDGADPYPRIPDSDYDLLLDGDEKLFYDSADKDGDTLLDGFEAILGTDYFGDIPRDKDADGLEDNQEVWVFALNSDGTVYGYGPDSDGDLVPNQIIRTLNSRPDRTPPASLAACFGVSGDEEGNNSYGCNGYSVFDIGERLKKLFNAPDTADAPNVRLFIRKFSNPTLTDSDADGLHDYTEVNDLSQIDLSTIDPTQLNGQIFIGSKSDPMNADTDGDGVRDGDEDFDGDYLRNRDDQASLQADVESVEHSYIRNPDRDMDGIPDGIEALVFGSNPGIPHSDGDGLSDNSEANFDELRDVRELVSVTEQCNDTELRSNAEIRLDDIAGKDYCVTIRMFSNPALNDSDYDGKPDASMDMNNDQINEPEDAFRMDPSCWRPTDGFGTQCYASWMAAQASLPSVRSLNVDHQLLFEAGLYGSDWDKLVRYDYLGDDLGLHYLPHIEITEAIVDFAYAHTTGNYLYLLSENGDLSRMTLAADGSVAGTIELGSVALDGHAAQALKVLNGYLLVQTTHDLTVYRDNNGVLEQRASEPITEAIFNIRDSYYDESRHLLYAIDGAMSDIGYLGVNTQTGQFEQSSPVFSGGDTNGTVRGPIAKQFDSVDDPNIEYILTGSGHRFKVSHSIAPVSHTIEPESQGWSAQIGTRTFNSFRHYLGNAEHETISVDFAVGASVTGPGRDGISNGLVVVSAASAANSALCPGSQNKYLNPMYEPNGKVMALLPYLDIETFAVIKNQRAVEILPMFLNDDRDKNSAGADSPDGISTLYERYYGLDPLKDSDRFGDSDEDSLTNVEEFQCGTDPMNDDSDSDGLYDDVEVVNGTSPTNPLDY